MSTPRRLDPSARLLVSSFITALLAPLGLHAQDAQPFDTASAPSEQLGYSATAPQLVGIASGDVVTVAAQRYTAGAPSSAVLTRFQRSGASLARVWEHALPLPRLVGATSDGTSVYAVSAIAEDLQSDTSTLSYRDGVLIMTKLDAQGNEVWHHDLNNAAYLGDAANGAVGSAIYSPLKDGTGAVTYGNGKIVVALGTNTTPDPSLTGDIKRHQRAQYFVVGADGSGFKAASETSWRHSFDQRVVFDGQNFVFADLGDAGWYMPGAGVALRKIVPNDSGADFVGDLEGVYVYARQAETAGNQNFSFTSLGDLELGANGYLALFTSEVTNRSDPRSGWDLPVAEPRNLGLVHVTKNFETVMEGQWDGQTRPGDVIITNDTPVEINVSQNIVDSAGPSTRFTRSDKPEKSFTQRGIVWLTNLPSGVSAERPKLVKVADDRYVALWEEWTYNGSQLAYQSTKALLVNEQGQVVSGATNIAARLNPSGADRAFAWNGSAAWITGSGGTLTLNSVDANLQLTSTAFGQAAPPPAPAVSDHLNPGQVLVPGDKIQSADGRYTLIYQTDGNLVLYDASGKALWASNTNGRPAGHASMQNDGNFAIDGPDGAFQWNTGTTSAGSHLTLQNDGNLVVVRADGSIAWSSGSGPAAAVRDRLQPGDALAVNDQLRSPDGRFTLVYQTDGNLVLYDASMSALWASNTSGRPAGRAVMQSDGNFAIFGPDGAFEWNTGTTVAGSQIVLQNDANLVIYNAAGGAVWATNTQR